MMTSLQFSKWNIKFKCNGFENTLCQTFNQAFFLGGQDNNISYCFTLERDLY